MRRFFFITLFLFLLSISAFAQNPSATPPVADDESIKISTNLIQLDVTVTDKDGKIVTDLKPEDFEVYENGKKQDITNFSFVSINPQVKKAENTAQQKNSKGQVVIPIPPVKLKQEQVRRTYAIVIDDLGLSFESTYWVQQSLKKFVREQMQDGDLVAIIRTGKGIGALQSFTSDKNQLLAAVDKIRWNSQGRGGLSAFEPISPSFKEQLSGEMADGSSKSVAGKDEDAEFAKQIDEFRNQNFSVGTLGALNYVIRGMRDLPGRKSLMLFTEGFQLISNGAPTRIFDALKVLADLANRSSVVIYTIDPRGLTIPGMLQAQDNTYLMDAAQVQARLDARNDAFKDSQMSLRYLAYETGGFPFVNQNNLNKGLQEAIDDQSSYYLLGYQPDADTFDPKKNKFNKLEIKVKRKGLKVRYRSGFFGITDEKMRAAVKQTPQQKVLSALTSPFNANDVNLSLYPIYGNDAKDGDFIRALVYIDTKDLKFTEMADGKRKTIFDLMAMTFGDNGIPIDRLSKIVTFEVNEKDYQNILEKGLVYDLAVPIKKPGAYQFRIALRDTASDKVGSASQFIEVPNLKKKKLALSNLVLDAFSPDEWKKISVRQNQADSEKGVFLDTTLRRFTRGSILQYNYVIYDAKPDKTRMETQTRLIRDGKVVFEGNRTPLKTEGQTDLQRLQASGAITLGNNLEAGTYILQVIVFDNSDGKKVRFVSQFVEFEITG
jgi:VWFA-related protein